jgi:hypothetical protein
MAMCETCWADAYLRARLLGGSQVDHYHRLLDERRDRPCTAPQVSEPERTK